MKYIICTELWLGIRAERHKFIEKLCEYDHTFQTRYVSQDDDLVECKLVSESHWEEDKYRIFYLDTEIELDIHALLDVHETSPIFLIARADDKYHVEENPLFASEHLKTLFDFHSSGRGVRDGFYPYPTNIRERPSDFEPC